MWGELTSRRKLRTWNDKYKYKKNYVKNSLKIYNRLGVQIFGQYVSDRLQSETEVKTRVTPEKGSH